MLSQKPKVTLNPSGFQSVFFSVFLRVCVCVCMHVHVHACAVAVVKRSEDNLWETSLSFHNVGPGGQTKVIKLGKQAPLSPELPGQPLFISVQKFCE